MELKCFVCKSSSNIEPASMSLGPVLTDLFDSVIYSLGELKAVQACPRINHMIKPVNFGIGLPTMLMSMPSQKTSEGKVPICGISACDML